jgi:hypothetical protein
VELQKNIKITLQKLKKFSKLKQSMESVMQKLDSDLIKKSEENGAIGSNISQEYLKQKFMYQKKQKNDYIEDIIIKEKSASRANKLMNMLSEKWSENPNNYRLLSKISDSMERRIKNVIV